MADVIAPVREATVPLLAFEVETQRAFGGEARSVADRSIPDRVLKFLNPLYVIPAALEVIGAVIVTTELIFLFLAGILTLDGMLLPASWRSPSEQFKVQLHYTLTDLREKRRDPNLYMVIITHVVSIPILLGSLVFRNTIQPDSRYVELERRDMEATRLFEEHKNLYRIHYTTDWDGTLNSNCIFNSEDNTLTIEGNKYHLDLAASNGHTQRYKRVEGDKIFKVEVNVTNGRILIFRGLNLDANLDPTVDYEHLNRRFASVEVAPPSDEAMAMSWEEVEAILTQSPRCPAARVANVKKFIKKIKERRSWQYVPRHEPHKSAWFDRHEHLLKGIAMKLRDTRFDDDDQTPSDVVTEIALAEAWCGVRYANILVQNWELLSQSAPANLEDQVIMHIKQFAVGICNEETDNVHRPAQMMYAISDWLNLGKSYRERGSGVNYVNLMREFFFQFTRESIVHNVVEAINSGAISKELFGAWLEENTEVPSDWLPGVFEGKEMDEEVTFAGIPYTKKEIMEELEESPQLRKAYYFEEVLYQGKSRREASFSAEHAQLYLAKAGILH